MSTGAARRPTLTVSDYLALEQESSVRHEYVAGVLYALAGASKRHNLIAGNLFRLLANAALGGPCRVYMSDVKLRAAADLFYYPDLMVVCGEEGDPLVEDAPCLVVEVSSPSTAAVDRREKLAAYKRIPSVEAYAVVDQDRRRVQRYWRDEEGVWWDAEVSGDGRVPLPCPAVTLGLDEIYAGIELVSDG
jgi:Uma2 family endonuclease